MGKTEETLTLIRDAYSSTKKGLLYAAKGSIVKVISESGGVYIVERVDGFKFPFRPDKEFKAQEPEIIPEKPKLKTQKKAKPIQNKNTLF